MATLAPEGSEVNRYIKGPCHVIHPFYRENSSEMIIYSHCPLRT